MKNEDKFRRFVATSAGLHVALFAFALLAPSIFPGQSSEMWGSDTGRNTGVKVSSVPSLPGIELPSPAVVQEKAAANDTKALHPSEPAPKPQEKVPAAPEVLIPSKNAKSKQDPQQDPKPAQTASTTPPAAPSNAIPGAGGQPAIPYGQAGAGAAQVTFGDESFGQRYGYYVRLMTNAIVEKWQTNIAGIARGTRVYVSFRIARDGKVTNAEIYQSSGSPIADSSALRAVTSAEMPPLPRDYSGLSVEVRSYYFEYAR